ncbi:MAG TPA: hypothetical protein VK968_00850 [Roseimicrobium sp.]|nr:hypothetical protein [Roseimicrobium sp.]
MHTRVHSSLLRRSAIAALVASMGLILAAWSFSIWYGASLRRTGNTDYVAITSEWGVLSYSWGHNQYVPAGFDGDIVRLVESHAWPVGGYARTGFRINHWPGFIAGQGDWTVGVPYWFMEFLLAWPLATLTIRRRRRSRRGFAVLPAT